MMGVPRVLRLLADPGSVRPWDPEVLSGHLVAFVGSRPYGFRLAEAQKRTGQAEAVWTGEVRIDGHTVVLVVSHFEFLGGSMGVAVGERVTRAFERAKARRLPVVAVVASGGVRMQEGVLAFMQMAKTADAARQFRRAGGRYLVYLAGPTTGGVLASWASLAQVTMAAPGAFVGLSGPRVLEATVGKSLPDGSQRAEQLFEWGLIDELVPPDRLRGRLVEMLDAIGDRPVRAKRAHVEASVVDAAPSTPRVPWSVIERSRDPSRPGATELLSALGGVAVHLRGDRAGGGDDPSCLTGIARLSEMSVMVVAQVRDSAGPASLGPAGYRKARRAMVLAEELGTPLLTIIDTSGAEATVAAEAGGMAAEVAGCLATMVALSVPTVAVLLGPGTGAGAVALIPADRVVAAELSWLAPLAPEGASALLYRTPTRAAEVAVSQRVVAAELAVQGIVDAVVPELPDAAAEPESFIGRLAGEVEAELVRLVAEPPSERLERRRRRYRALGADLHWPPASAGALLGQLDGRDDGSASKVVATCLSGKKETHGD